MTAADDVVHPWFRLGYIVPHRHVDMDAYQFHRVAPDGAMLVTTTLDLHGYDVADVERETARVDDAVDVLHAAGVDFISLSGVPIGAALGRGATTELVGAMEARSGLPCSTDIEAHVAALGHLGVDRVALATRWPPEVVDRLQRYLGDAGVEVVASASEPRSLADNKRADAADDHDLALRLGREALGRAHGAQALLLPGGLWFAIHAAAQLEQELDVPVLLNITSTVWHALSFRPGRLPRRSSPRWGRLLASL